MLDSEKKILANIDATLDQLICNAEAVSASSIQALETVEVEALQKTQESLLAHLLHMNAHLTTKREQKTPEELQKKIVYFAQLNARLMNEVALKFNISPRRLKPSRRSKK